MEVRVGIRIRAEPNARVATLGEAGISHDHKHDKAAVIDRAVKRAGRELHIAAWRERHAAESVFETMHSSIAPVPASTK